MWDKREAGSGVLWVRIASSTFCSTPDADPATAAETSGSVAWRTVRDLLRGSSFYNVALPRRGTAPPPTAPVEQTEPADGWTAAFEVVDAG